ncbi:MAG: OmpH family outer membrane protein [Pseudomonadales bacterium]|uniref:Outer membrane protein n=1 Tax=Oleiphilus messinensis TaxID=141451 RepID=A0A1Y0I9I4_9GAMM|nr:OmpH family outer membrane protein [Oleiphilus messinensis]ARU56053.1 outer membrane protein [Oleiphilus messinensis]MCG8610089.1 OmpH family outer membrane protein [Pseudomonadales bacterium]
MKALKHGLFCLLVLFGTMNVQAETKIAVVDIRAALFNSEAAQAFGEKLKQEFAKDESEVKKVGDEAQKMQERIKKDAAMMSDSERAKMASEFELKAKEFNYLKNKFESAVNTRKQDFLRDSKPKLDRALEEVAKAEKVDLLLPREATLFVVPSLDLTPKVIEKLNAK